MTRRLAATALVLVAILMAGCSSAGGDSATTQEKFGVRMARMSLWREAMFRFQRAVEMNPDDATAHSNLAVALEANGDFEGAAKAYREALRLDKSNQYIQKNYSRFVEFTTRDRRRQQRRPASPGATPAAAQSKPPAPDDPPLEAPPEAPAEAPHVVPVVDPEGGQRVPTATEAADPVDGDPAPTGAAPAATPAPNPAPPQTPPPQPDPPPPGGQS